MYLLVLCEDVVYVCSVARRYDHKIECLELKLESSLCIFPLAFLSNHKFHSKPTNVTFNKFLLSGQGAHPPADERVYDIQQTTPRSGASTPPEPRQQNSEQNFGRMVVCSNPCREATIPRSCFKGKTMPAVSISLYCLRTA